MAAQAPQLLPLGQMASRLKQPYWTAWNENQSHVFAKILDLTYFYAKYP